MSIPLASAYLCVNCDHVSNSGIRCGHCSSEFGLLSLANVLDRPVRDVKMSTIQLVDKAAEKLRDKFESYLQIA